MPAPRVHPWLQQVSIQLDSVAWLHACGRGLRLEYFSLSSLLKGLRASTLLEMIDEGREIQQLHAACSAADPSVKYS